MHKNPRFNIVQAATGFNNRNFVVIEGQRANGGYPERGSKVLTKEMSRDDAIKVADKMERDIPFQ